jgi:hypothetical protein
MSKKLKLTEEQLTGIVKKIVEQQLSDDEVLARLEDGGMVDDEQEGEIEKILTPEEIVGLLTDQITQLQDRVQYMEELNADVLEFISYQMQDLERTDIGAELKKSKQKLRALETRAGREIFWLKSRRL